MNRQLLTVAAIVFVDLLGFGIVLPLMPTYAASLGVTPGAIGVLVMSFSLLQLLVAPAWGALSDRIGRRPVLLVGLAGSAASYLLFAFAQGYWSLLASRIVAGGMGATVGVAQAYIADITPPERRAQSLGMLGAAFALGFIFGPALGGVLYTDSSQAAGLGAAIFCTVNALAAFLWLRETPQHLSRQPRGAVALRPLASALVSMFLLITAFAVIHLSLPLYADQVLGHTPRRMGTMFAFMGAVSAVVQGGLVGRIAPRVGEARLATIGGLILAVGLTLIPEAHTTVALYGALAALAAGQAVASPSILAVVSRRTAAADQGAALGITQTAANLGRIGGPLGAGFLYDGFGAPAPFFAGAVVALLAAVATRFLPGSAVLSAGGFRSDPSGWRSGTGGRARSRDRRSNR